MVHQSQIVRRPLSLPPTFRRSLTLTLTHPRSLSLPKLSLSIASKSSFAPLRSLSIASFEPQPLEIANGGAYIGSSDSGSGSDRAGGSGKRGGNGGSGSLGGGSASAGGGSGFNRDETLKTIGFIVIVLRMIQLVYDMFVDNRDSGQIVHNKSGGRTRVLNIVKTSAKLLLLLSQGRGSGKGSDGGDAADWEGPGPGTGAGKGNADWWESNSKLCCRAVVSLLLIPSCIKACFSTSNNNDDDRQVIRTTNFLKLVNMIANTILLIAKI